MATTAVLGNEPTTVERKGFSSNWIKNEINSDTIKEVYSVEQLKKAGFQPFGNIMFLNNKKKTPYLLVNDLTNNTKSAVYLSLPLRASLLGITTDELKAGITKAEEAGEYYDYSALNGVVLTADQFGFVVLEDSNGDEYLQASKVGGSGSNLTAL